MQKVSPKSSCNIFRNLFNLHDDTATPLRVISAWPRVIDAATNVIQMVIIVVLYLKISITHGLATSIPAFRRKFFFGSFWRAKSMRYVPYNIYDVKQRIPISRISCIAWNIAHYLEWTSVRIIRMNILYTQFSEYN